MTSRDSTSCKTILITGASSGIGRALALELAERGHRLALTARRADRLEQLAAEARAHGAEVVTVPADLADSESPARLVTAVLERFGGLDVLINNAGHGLPDLFGHSDPDDLRSQIEVNFAAPILLTRRALPHLIVSRGIIINIGSAITSVANPIYGAYGASKAGLAYWNDALRRELRHHGVHVCLVEPGPVATEFFEAVDARANGQPGLGIGPTPDNLYNPMRDRPPALLTADPRDAARRIVRLLDHPRRRISFLRRMIWPWRLVGGFFQLFPALGDLAVSGMIWRIGRKQAQGAPVVPRSDAVSRRSE